MKQILSLGTRELVLEPETEFEKEIMGKYFQESEVKAFMGRDNVLRIKFSGPASRTVREE